MSRLFATECTEKTEYYQMQCMIKTCCHKNVQRGAVIGEEVNHGSGFNA